MWSPGKDRCPRRARATRRRRRTKTWRATDVADGTDRLRAMCQNRRQLFAKATWRMCCICGIQTNGMFYGFAEAADWRAFQHFDEIREPLENRKCNTSGATLLRHEERDHIAPGVTL